QVRKIESGRSISSPVRFTDNRKQIGVYAPTHCRTVTQQEAGRRGGSRKGKNRSGGDGSRSWRLPSSASRSVCCQYVSVSSSGRVRLRERNPSGRRTIIVPVKVAVRAIQDNRAPLRIRNAIPPIDFGRRKT